MTTFAKLTRAATISTVERWAVFHGEVDVCEGIGGLSASTDNLFWVLHLRTAHDTRADDLNARLRRTGAHVHDVQDVYEALFELKNHLPDRPVFVLVAVDAMDFSELEFFGMIDRVQPGVRSYVYGSHHSRERIDLALREGATGPANPTIIVTLVRDAMRSTSFVRAVPTNGTESSDTGSTRPRATTGPEVVAPTFHPPNEAEELLPEESDIGILDDNESELVESLGPSGPTNNVVSLVHGGDIEEYDSEEESNSETDDATTLADDPATSPARVPWLRYAPNANRSAPSRGVPRSKTNEPSRPVRIDIGPSKPSPARKQPEPVREALLTPEELEALLSESGVFISPEKSTSTGEEE